MKASPYIVVVVAVATWIGCSTTRPKQLRATPGDVHSMMTQSRTALAMAYGRKESRLMYERVHYPYTFILTNDTDYFVSFIDAETYSKRVVESNEVTRYETVSAFIKPDGTVIPNGFSTKTTAKPATPLHEPRPAPTNIATRLPMLDYVQLAREALRKEFDQETIDRQIPFACSFEYAKSGNPASGIRYIWVMLFDPNDIEPGLGEGNDSVSGYVVLIKPDGVAHYRGRGRFGSSRFREIADLLHPTPAATTGAP